MSASGSSTRESFLGTTRWLRTDDGSHVFCYTLDTDRVEGAYEIYQNAVSQFWEAIRLMPENARVKVTVEVAELLEEK